MEYLLEWLSMSRAKKKKNSQNEKPEWIIGFYTHRGEKSVMAVQSESEEHGKKTTGLKFVEVDHCTLCRFSGFKDKNGNLIYENDICDYNGMARFIVGVGSYTDHTGERHYGFYARWIGKMEGAFSAREELSCWNDYVNVVGNTVENPELRKRTLERSENLKMLKRASWDEYFMEIAEIVKTRSTCLRRQVGAVIVKDNRIITTGYNGAPTGLEHCVETGGCMRQILGVPSGERHELCRALHAEQNAVIQAAKIGVSTEGATIYITLSPCMICAKILINAGIRRVVYVGEYPDKAGADLLRKAGVEIVRMSSEYDKAEKKNSEEGVE